MPDLSQIPGLEEAMKDPVRREKLQNFFASVQGGGQPDMAAVMDLMQDPVIAPIFQSMMGESPQQKSLPCNTVPS